MSEYQHALRLPIVSICEDMKVAKFIHRTRCKNFNLIKQRQNVEFGTTNTATASISKERCLYHALQRFSKQSNNNIIDHIKL